MNIRNYILTTVATLAFAASAQYNQTISVDGKYVPEVFRLDRINSFPKPVKFTLESTPLSYESKSVPAAFTPRLVTTEATGWHDTRALSDKRGYLDLGLGSWLNSTLSAGYRIIDNSSTTFGVRLQHNSTSLWKPKVSNIVPDTKMWRYDECLGLYTAHNFSGKGTLSASADYHFGRFNYYGFNPTTIHENYSSHVTREPKAPQQTMNDGALSISWEAPRKVEHINWNVGFDARYFGYLYYFDPIHDVPFPQPVYDKCTLRTNGSNETALSLHGSVDFPLSTSSFIGLDINDTWMIYYNANNQEFYPESPANYNLLTLTPYYSFKRDRLLVRLGADIDIASNAGDVEYPFYQKPDEVQKYATLHVAPDVKLDYLTGPVSFYFHALGGSRLHTLASGYELNYYQSPGLSNSRPVYTPLDATLGISFGPFSGFSASAHLAYRISRGEYLGGWYMARLNNGNTNPGLENLPQEITINGYPEHLYYYLYDDFQYNIHGVSLGASLKYDLGKIIKIKAKGTYQPQNNEKGYFNGYDRPQLTADITAETNPWSTLKLKAGYSFRGKRAIYTKAEHYGNLYEQNFTLVSCKLPNLSNLSFGASYGISDNFNVWVQGDNLLNRHDVTLPGLPQQGICLYAGCGITF